MSKDNSDCIHAVDVAIDRVCETRNRIIFQSDRHSPRKVEEYLASVKALIQIIPEKHLSKNHSKRMMRVIKLYENYHYPQVITELDKVVKKIFRKLNGDGFLKR